MRTTQEAKLLLLSTGVIGSLVEQTQSALQARGISADWVSLPQIKPFPSDEIQTLLLHYNTVATFEEHSRIGGMGSALAECITDAFPTLQTKLIRFGTQDWFLHETGSLEYARQRHLLDLERVIAQITERC